MESKEQSLSKIVTALSGVNWGKDVEENHIKRIANALEGVTKEKGKSIIEILSGGSGGAGGGSLVLLCDLGDNYEVSLESGSKSDVASMFGITEDDVDRLLNGEFAFVNITSKKDGQTKTDSAQATKILVGKNIEFGFDADVFLGLEYTNETYSGSCYISWPRA